MVTEPPGAAETLSFAAFPPYLNVHPGYAPRRTLGQVRAALARRRRRWRRTFAVSLAVAALCLAGTVWWIVSLPVGSGWLWVSGVPPLPPAALVAAVWSRRPPKARLRVVGGWFSPQRKETAMSLIVPDLDATIAAAVTARIEAEVTKALSGDEVLGRLVTAALTQQVDATDDRYDRTKSTFLARVLRDAIQTATKDAVARLLADEAPAIEAEVRKALKAGLSGIAAQLVQSLTDSAQKAYGVTLTVKMPGQ